MELQISSECTLRLSSGGHVQREEVIVSAFEGKENIENFFFFATKFKSSEINSTTVRTIKPQKHVTKNVQTARPAFLHFSFFVVAATWVY